MKYEHLWPWLVVEPCSCFWLLWFQTIWLQGLSRWQTIEWENCSTTFYRIGTNHVNTYLLPFFFFCFFFWKGSIIFKRFLCSLANVKCGTLLLFVFSEFLPPEILTFCLFCTLHARMTERQMIPFNHSWLYGAWNYNFIIAANKFTTWSAPTKVFETKRFNTRNKTV
jgi:hypothetical protein